jgi:radical SAM protein with 4Fe4S-binding SPASM domain
MDAYDSYMRAVNQFREGNTLFSKVEIEVNIGCNRKCAYCFLATRRRESVVQSKSRTMEMELFALLLSQLSDLSFSGEINFHFYSEPLLNMRLENYVEATRRKLPNVAIVLYTNGDRLDRNRYRQLQTAGVTKFYVTFHDDRIPESREELRTRPDVVYDTRSMILLNNRGGYLGACEHEQVSKLPCIYPSSSIIVTIDGNVLPCSCDFDEQMCFGNIKAASLANIWNSEKAQLFRSDLLAGLRAKHALCKDCDYYSSVLGLPSVAESSRNH